MNFQDLTPTQIAIIVAAIVIVVGAVVFLFPSATPHGASPLQIRS